MEEKNKDLTLETKIENIFLNWNEQIRNNFHFDMEKLHTGKLNEALITEALSLSQSQIKKLEKPSKEKIKTIIRKNLKMLLEINLEKEMLKGTTDIAYKVYTYL